MGRVPSQRSQRKQPASLWFLGRKGNPGKEAFHLEDVEEKHIWLMCALYTSSPLISSESVDLRCVHFLWKIRMVPAIFLKSVVRGCPFFTATVAVRKEVLQVGVAWAAQHSYLYSNITHLTSIWILHSAHTFTIVINSTIIKFQLCARYYYMQ